ncbi:unnamed protein product [Linum trigynum]|uniref:Structural maintenance of chromosomes protein 5 n=1 Tax=Linum trigynum TaxID=586398 RepID=A0AAV2F286_9ROSI
MHQSCRIQNDLVDPEKLQATLADGNLSEDCDMKKALEMVILLQAQLKEMNPNLDSITEYRGKVALYNERVEELNAVTQNRDHVKRLDEFLSGFNSISLKLKELYQMITLGGDAELELVDSLDPFSEDVVFSTLSSLALVFALHHYKPTPLYVMDEIDSPERLIPVEQTARQKVAELKSIFRERVRVCPESNFTYQRI